MEKNPMAGSAPGDESNKEKTTPRDSGAWDLFDDFNDFARRGIDLEAQLRRKELGDKFDVVAFLKEKEEEAKKAVIATALVSNKPLPVAKIKPKK